VSDKPSWSWQKRDMGKLASVVGDIVFQALMPALPKDDLSFWVGRLMHVKLPEPLRVPALKAFVKAYDINTDEAEKPLEAYQSIGDLFIRKLKEDARPIGRGFVHPCDSKIAEAGVVKAGRLTQVKGITYTAEALLKSKELGSLFEDGSFVTYYLCPTDYHRVHVPFDASVEEVHHIPGAFWPVNEWSVQNIDQLYAVNERMAMIFRTADGERFALVMVAATNVGAIRLAFDPRFDSTHRPSGRKGLKVRYGRDAWRSDPERVSSLSEYIDADPIHLKKADEAGLFAMGSSVVLLLDQNLSAKFQLSKAKLSSLVGRSVQVGQPI
jgi:phosphatidylserine decarboxylase